MAVLLKEWCSECKGTGHTKDCKCEGPLGFVMGCCERCGADGMITLGTCYCDEPKLIGPCPVHGEDKLPPDHFKKVQRLPKVPPPKFDLLLPPKGN